MQTKLMLLLVLSFSFGCAKNPFASAEKKDTAEDATIFLEKREPQKAIDLLEKELVNDPDNYTFKSLLSMAYAQRAGVDPLTLAQKVAGGNSGSTSNGIAALFPYLPAATDANIADVDRAIALLNSLPSGTLIIADVFKLGIFLTASTALRAKKLDVNGDGILSAEELLNMSASSALQILSNIVGAAAAFSTSAEYTDAAKKAQSQIGTIQTKIGEQQGANDSEKVKNYLASRNTPTN